MPGEPHTSTDVTTGEVYTVAIVCKAPTDIPPDFQHVMVHLLRSSALPAFCAVVLVLAGCSSGLELAAQRAPAEPAPIEAGVAPPPGPYAPGFDALHYDVELSLPDTGSYLEGITRALVLLEEPRRDTLALDFSGLAVMEVAADGMAVDHRHKGGRLYIPVPPGSKTGDTLEVSVSYGGHPDDGLILGRNIHGEPTAFADNWPDRARFWFPSIDHPSDKATVQFTVRLPDGDTRSVISNGARQPSTEPSVWRWAVHEPIPTYTMVVGAANFDVSRVGESCFEGRCTEVTTWLYPQDARRGAASFLRGAQMIDFYSELIAPYPYEKLAHVQSATRFGGMENVGAVFYPEQPIHQGRDLELTVAHETAHQWFGNAVTETDWHHLWLSEGFATYFGALFFEHADGVERFREIMAAAADAYLTSGAWERPVVDAEERNLFGLLNANNYDKGSWVLHMLRRQLGDEVFFEGIRAFYRAHRHGNALTEDLRNAMESVSDTSLRAFFRQWIYEPGHPQLEITWMPSGETVELRVRQVQPPAWPAFAFPLDLAFETRSGTVRRSVSVSRREETFLLDLPAEATRLDVDPDGDLLKEIVSIGRRNSR